MPELQLGGKTIATQTGNEEAVLRVAARSLTTRSQPNNPVKGDIYLDSTTDEFKIYSGSTWIVIVDTTKFLTVDYLAIAGGGGAAYAGGGAGGVLSATNHKIYIGNTTVTIGAGGAGGIPGSNGGDSSIGNDIVAIGGGGGGAYASGANTRGRPGGSGGGEAYAKGSGPGGGVVGQGNGGGYATYGNSNNAACGGGGGAGGPGQDGHNLSEHGGGAGGTGTAAFSTWATATSTGVNGFYAGGGGGGRYNGNSGSGYNGGGGASNAGTGTAGSANTGGGGGGGLPGAAGGSGIVIIRYLGSTQATGGTITSAGGYTYHTFLPTMPIQITLQFRGQVFEEIRIFIRY